MQVGDSSGLVSVKPELIEPYLPEGWHYLNASLQVPAQYEGFETIAERILSKDKKRKYLVGMFTIFNIGNRDEGFGNEIKLNYDSVWRYLLAMPSLKYRGIISDMVCYYPHPVTGADDYREHLTSLHDILARSRGWLGVDMHTPFVGQLCPGNTYDSALATERLERLLALAKRYNVTLVLALGPLRCNPSDATTRITHDFEEFHRRYPEVIFPLPIYNQIPAQYMGDEVHVTSKEGAEYYSRMWGEALHKALATARN